MNVDDDTHVSTPEVGRAKSVSEYFSDFLFVKNILISYIFALLYLAIGLTIFVSPLAHVSGTVLAISALVVFVLFAIGFIIHREDMNRNVTSGQKIFGYLLLLGTVFGFLLNGEHMLATFLSGTGSRVTLWGIDAYFSQKVNGRSLLDLSYLLMGGFIGFVVINTLTKFVMKLQEESMKLKKRFSSNMYFVLAVMLFVGTLFLVAGAVISSGNSRVLLILYIMTGSLVGVYGHNLFSRNSHFLRRDGVVRNIPSNLNLKQ